MQGLKFKIRIAVFFVLMAAACIGFVYKLYDLQIVHGDEYLDTSQNSITQSVTVAASRGDILDRYNRVLVTNRVSYNVVISRSVLLRQEEPNEIVWNLIEICDAAGVGHSDTLPFKKKECQLMKTASDYNMSLFNKVLDFCDIDRNLSDEEKFELLLEHYEIDEDWDYEKQRQVMGVRYELELRVVINMSAYIFASDVDTELIATIKGSPLPSVSIETSSVRVYNTQYAAHLLGRVGPIYAEEYDTYKQLGYSMNAIVGKEGVEYAFEETLHGTDGSQTILTNIDGTVTSVTTTREPEPGDNVVLTLDIALQAVAEQSLEKHITELRETEDGADAAGGAVVVVEIGTGDVLALANYPTYNIETYGQVYNQLLEDPYNPLLNRALTGLYEPGSTFKMTTAIAAMENDVISSSTVITDEGKYDVYDDYKPNCWIFTATGTTHGDQTVIDAICNSCNYFFYETGRLTGIDLISQYAYALGLGVPTGVELYEEVGTVANPETAESLDLEWVAGDTLQASIGQSLNAYTPLQLANYTATLANEGQRMQAHLFERSVSYDYTQVTEEFKPVIMSDLELDEDTVYSVTEGMRRVITEGTVSEVFVDFDVEVAGKTGTAQTGQVANNAVFVCYAPYDDPEIAVAVVVEKGGSGSSIAAVARDVLEYYFSQSDDLPKGDNENALLH